MGETGKELCNHMDAVSPSGFVTMGVCASGIQANCDDRVEHDIDATLMLGNFPVDRTDMVPFYLEDCDAKTLIEKTESVTPEGVESSSYWKVFIVNVCGSGFYSAETFVATLQQKYPNAAIVGGMCSSGFISTELTREELTHKSVDQLHELLNLLEPNGNNPMDMDELDEDFDEDKLLDLVASAVAKRKYVVQEVDDGIFGVAFGGDVPVRSIVSRGVKNVTGGDEFSDDPSRWVVEHVDFARPGDEEYMFRGDPELLKPVHMIRRVKDGETGNVASPLSMLAHVNEHQPEFVGLRRPGADGYELHPLSPFSLQSNCIVLMTDGSPEQEESLRGASIDLFALDAQACLDHMDGTLEKLKAQTENEVILGGIMFSCSGRGPERRSMLRREMADATLFHKHFPDVGLCGYYAGGEIGPMAMVGKRNIFQSGKAAVQGFTAVFALFIVPVVKPGSFQIDDSPENIMQFVKASLAGA